jgi:hypothetical protein
MNMFEEDSNLHGHATIVGCIDPDLPKDHNAFMFRDGLTLQMMAL